MKNSLELQLEVYFADFRLKMSFLGRGIARVVGYVFYLFLIAATLTFLFSGINWLLYLGFFLAIFLIDYLIHFRQGDRALSELPKSGKVNLAKFMTPATFHVLEKALDRSVFKKTDFFLEIIKQLIKIKTIKEGLVRMDIKMNEFEQKADGFLVESIQKEQNKSLAQEQLQILIKLAFGKALSSRQRFIQPHHLLSALAVVSDEWVGRLFNLFEVQGGDLEKALIFSSFSEHLSKFRSWPSTLSGFVPGVHRRIRHRIMNRAWTSRPTRVLDRYSLDLTDLARQGETGFLIGHKAEYERLVDALSRSVNPNALLVGEEGIGKETLIAHLAFNISKDQVPAALFDKRLVSFQISDLVAGATPEIVQDRLQQIVSEIITAGNVILYLPEFHDLVKTSGTAYLSAADALVPIIKNSAFPVIGATYPPEFKRDIESRSDLVGSFEVIRVNEITQDEAEEVLVYESLLLERSAKVVISFGAIKKSVYLAKKYFTNRFLPSSAGDLLRSALAGVKQKEKKVLEARDVIAAAEAKVNVPMHEAGEEESKKLLNLEKIIHEKLIDQEEAVKAVANVLREYRSGLARSGGPIASFLFVGPTGVGKTELAKILAEVQFGAREAMIRFDMTEYQDKQSFFRFIGSPDGKISGSLTDAVLEKPYSLILLDEFEKAFTDIWDLFLQVFDDGRLTDNMGRVVDFSNTIIIATSNAHSDIINQSLRAGETMAKIAEYFKKKLIDVFKPELLNRFTKIVVFNNLSSEDILKVTMIRLRDFAKIVEGQGIFLEFEEEAARQIARLGFDPEFGARPLERVIAEKLRAPLAEKILKGEAKRGARLKVIKRGEDLEFGNS